MSSNDKRDAEFEAQRQIDLDRATEIIENGKKVPAKELAALIRNFPAGLSLPTSVLDHIADRLEGKAGKGRPVSLYQSVDHMFRDPQIRDEFPALKKKYGYTAALKKLGNEYHRSPEQIRHILNAE